MAARCQSDCWSGRQLARNAGCNCNGIASGWFSQPCLIRAAHVSTQGRFVDSACMRALTHQLLRVKPRSSAAQRLRRGDVLGCGWPETTCAAGPAAECWTESERAFWTCLIGTAGAKKATTLLVASFRNEMCVPARTQLTIFAADGRLMPGSAQALERQANQEHTARDWRPHPVARVVSCNRNCTS